MTTLINLTNISIVIIALEVFVMLLIPGIIFYFLNRGMIWILTQVRIYGPLGRYYAAQAARVTEDLSHKAAAPLIEVSATMTRINRIRSAVAASLSLSRKEV